MIPALYRVSAPLGPAYTVKVDEPTGVPSVLVVDGIHVTVVEGAAATADNETDSAREASRRFISRTGNAATAEGCGLM